MDLRCGLWESTNVPFMLQPHVGGTRIYSDAQGSIYCEVWWEVMYLKGPWVVAALTHVDIEFEQEIMALDVYAARIAIRSLSCARRPCWFGSCGVPLVNLDRPNIVALMLSCWVNGARYLGWIEPPLGPEQVRRKNKNPKRKYNYHKKFKMYANKSWSNW